MRSSLLTKIHVTQIVFSLHQARKLCPTVATIPYEFEKYAYVIRRGSLLTLYIVFRYKQTSLKLYTILMTHADDLQAVSVDEALVDVTTAVRQMPSSERDRYDPAKVFAEMLRAEIKNATGCDSESATMKLCEMFLSANSQHWDFSQHHARSYRYSQS